MSQRVVLSDFSDGALQLLAGSIIDDTRPDMAQLRAAGLNDMPLISGLEAEINAVIYRYKSVRASGVPQREDDLVPMLLRSVAGAGLVVTSNGQTVQELLDAGGGPATQLDANGTILDISSIPDGYLLARSGSDIIGIPSSGGGGGGGIIDTFSGNVIAGLTPNLRYGTNANGFNFIATEASSVTGLSVSINTTVASGDELVVRVSINGTPIGAQITFDDSSPLLQYVAIAPGTYPYVAGDIIGLQGDGTGLTVDVTVTAAAIVVGSTAGGGSGVATSLQDNTPTTFPIGTLTEGELVSIVMGEVTTFPSVTDDQHGARGFQTSGSSLLHTLATTADAGFLAPADKIKIDALPLNNYTATTAPGVNDDSGVGYSVGSEWVDTTAGISYVCVDASSGAAVWLQTAPAPVPGVGPYGEGIWVDSAIGDDATGTRGDDNRPFATPNAALAVFQQGDFLQLGPGQFTLPMDFDIANANGATTMVVVGVPGSTSLIQNGATPSISSTLMTQIFMTNVGAVNPGGPALDLDGALVVLNNCPMPDGAGSIAIKNSVYTNINGATWNTAATLTDVDYAVLTGGAIFETLTATNTNSAQPSVLIMTGGARVNTLANANGTQVFNIDRGSYVDELVASIDRGGIYIVGAVGVATTITVDTTVGPSQIQGAAGITGVLTLNVTGGNRQAFAFDFCAIESLTSTSGLADITRRGGLLFNNPPTLDPADTYVETEPGSALVFFADGVSGNASTAYVGRWDLRYKTLQAAVDAADAFAIAFPQYADNLSVALCTPFIESVVVPATLGKIRFTSATGLQPWTAPTGTPPFSSTTTEINFFDVEVIADQAPCQAIGVGGVGGVTFNRGAIGSTDNAFPALQAEGVSVGYVGCFLGGALEHVDCTQVFMAGVPALDAAPYFRITGNTLQTPVFMLSGICNNMELIGDFDVSLLPGMTIVGDLTTSGVAPTASLNLAGKVFKTVTLEPQGTISLRNSFIGEDLIVSDAGSSFDIAAEGVTVVGDIDLGVNVHVNAFNGNFDWSNITLGASASLNWQNNYNASIAPSVNDDETVGYRVGSVWIIPGGSAYLCTSPAAGAAIWLLQGGPPTALAFPTIALSTYTILLTDSGVVMDFAAARTVDLPASAPNGTTCTVCDGAGTAAAANITVNAPIGETFIGGVSTDLINSNGASMTYRKSGTRWSKI